MSLNTLKSICYSSFNAIVSYVLHFWGKSRHNFKVSRIQIRIIRVMLGCKQRVSCRNLIKKLKILPLASQYVLFLMLVVVNNTNLFTLNSQHYATSTRQPNKFYQPMTSFTTYQNEYTTWVWRYSTVFLSPWRKYPVMLENLKFAYKIFTYKFFLIHRWIFSL